MRTHCSAIFILFVLAGLSHAQDAVKIGDTVGKLRFTDIRSVPRTLEEFGKKKAYVLVFTNATCPVAQRYLPTLQALESKYRAKDVQFISVNSAQEDTIIAMATQAVRHEMEFPFVKDFDASCARALGVKRTPEAVVLDAGKRLRYRGRIDDQFRVTGVRKAATSNDLRTRSKQCSRGRMSRKRRRRSMAVRSRSPRRASRGT